MATMFSGGTLDCTLCTGQKMNPPPGAKISIRSRTCSGDHLRRLAPQHVLRVTAAAPEDDPPPELLLQTAGVHVGGRRLDWIEAVQPGVDQAGDQVVERAA